MSAAIEFVTLCYKIIANTLYSYLQINLNLSFDNNYDTKLTMRKKIYCKNAYKELILFFPNEC